jgi:ribosomal protein S6--L-glutamate ligase
MFDVVVDQSIKLNSIPKKNETILLNWRHNLAFGAKPVIVKNPILIKKLKNITKDVLKVINIKFCAIDIADVNHKLMVVEINNGIMFEKFSKSSKKNFTITKNVYLKAINYILQHKQHTSC